MTSIFDDVSAANLADVVAGVAPAGADGRYGT
jgi:hypothetical protein